MPDARVTKLSFHHYRAFEEYSIRFDDHCLLVGANNAGKSTIIGALRLAARLLASAKQRRASDSPHRIGTRQIRVYPIVASQRPAKRVSIPHEFRQVDSSFTVHFSGDQSLTATWPTDPEKDPYFYLDMDGEQPLDVRDVRLNFPEIGVIPVLAPCEEEETLLDSKYIRGAVDTNLSSRHFRNNLMRMDVSELQGYRNLVELWAPEIELQIAPGQIGLGSAGRFIDLHYREPGRPTVKEISWAGDGLQIWLQVLYHLNRLKDASSVVLDEPDVFLHPDLQRRLVRILEDLSPQTITATHSAEMVSESSRSTMILVDKSKRQSSSVTHEDNFEQVSTIIGSGFNLSIAKALRAKLALLVEGDDIAMIRELAKKIGCPRTASEIGLAAIGMGGFAQWPGAKPFQWIKSSLLHDTVAVRVILDRDYRLDEECSKIVSDLRRNDIGAHIWRRKEIENYLIEPSIVGRATGLSTELVRASLLSIADQHFRGDVEAQLVPRYQSSLPKSLDESTRYAKARDWFNELWQDDASRLARTPGKKLLRRTNDWLRTVGAVGVTPHTLIQSCRVEELDNEIVEQIRYIERLLE